MLYVTTRSKADVFTAQRILGENRAEDGGLYLPFHTPKFSESDLQELLNKSFGQITSEILNLLFGTKLTSWDVDFSIGRYPVRLESLHHRILIAETWHNPDWTYERLVMNLSRQLQVPNSAAGNWTKIGIRIAVLFGIFGELKRQGIDSADISLVSGDFSGAMSAWYARSWGLPIDRIIGCCNENNGLWDLICHGQIRTDTVSIPTNIPEADITMPEDLERLIYECGGTAEVRNFLEIVWLGKTYFPGELVLKKIRRGLYASVVSSSRINDVISGIYGTNGYLMSPHTALAYAGLLDYRSRTGETGHSVVLSEKSPIACSGAIARALDIPEKEVRRLYG